MVRIWASMLAGALVLILSFQNCSEQEAAKPASNGTDLTVDGTDTTGGGEEVPAEEPPADDPPAATNPQATNLLFGYDEATMSFKYNFVLASVTVNDADGNLVKTLTNDERSLIVGFFGNQVVSDSQPHNATICDAADYGAGVYAEILTNDPNVTLTLNQAAFDCGGVDFGDGLTNTQRITADVGGVQTLLIDILAGHIDSIENP